MFNLTRVIHPLASIVAIALITAACSGSDTTTPVSDPPIAGVVTTPETTFPTGLAVGSPTELSTTTTVASVSHGNDSMRYAADFGRAFWAALKDNDRVQLAKLAGKAIPISPAYAAPAKSPDLANDISTVQKVLSGDTSISLGTVLDFDKLFTSATNAPCYGPSMAYATHQDAPPATTNSGTLPGGDLGIWLEYEGSQPCVAAQLKQRVRGIKAQTLQGLMMMAAMRRSVTTSTALTMPAASATTDLTTEFETVLRGHTRFAAFDVGVATISRDSTGNIYTYRLTLNNGLTGASAKSGEVIMIHTPGSSSTAFSGVMQVAAFSLSSDAGMSCSDVTDSGTGMFQVASVNTLKYSRAGTAVSFNNRSGSYCGHPTSFTASGFGTAVASYTTGGELDPSVSLTGGIRGTTKGWVGNFSRFAGNFNLDHLDGDFRYAWQAGPQDNNSRMLALDTSYNTASEVRTLKGYFGFGADISSSNSNMLGMICNWAGPGNNHTTGARFQSQTAELTASATEFTIPSGGSKITYAPTTSCSSTTTQFDANVNGTLTVGEGTGTTHNLDIPSGTLTVEQEIQARGFTPPTLY